MISTISQPNIKHISVKKLHPTFGAEVSEVDFSNPVPDDVFHEILAVMIKASFYLIYSFRLSCLHMQILSHHAH